MQITPTIFQKGGAGGETSPMSFPRSQLLSGRGFFLLCPAALDGLGNALASFRGKIPLLFFLGVFLGGGDGRDLLGLGGSAAGQQGAGPLQLSNFVIDLYQNL